MSFLFPAFLIGGISIAIPIVLHLLRREVAPEVPFAAVHLLRQSPIERTKRKRLRHLLLLAARVAALLLLASAFARPYRADAVQVAGVVIVAIDRSYSMDAPGTFERARQLARAAVDAAGPARVGVIAFDDSAEMIAPLGSADDARRAIDGVRPGFGSTRYARAITRAVAMADGAPGRVVIVSDLQRSGWDDEGRAVVASGLAVDVQDAGGASSNVAVVRVRVEPGTVTVTLRNSGASAYAGRVTLSIDDQQVALAPAQFSPDTTLDVPIRYRAPAAGTLTASIDDPAGFAADNRRVVALDPVPRRKILAVISSTTSPSSGFYLSRAIEAADSEDGGFEVTSVDAATLASVPAERLSSFAAVCLLSTRNIERGAREALIAFVRGGGGLFISAGPDVDAELLADLLGAASRPRSDLEDSRPRALAITDPRHPIFQPFGSLSANLGQVRFDRAWRYPVDGWTVVAPFTDGTPALLERSEGAGRIVLFTSDLDRRWNDFPLHPSFVPFTVEVVRHVAGTDAAGRDLVIADAPPGMDRLPGVHRTPDGRTVVLNVDTRESALSRVTPEEFAGMLERVEANVQGPAAVRAQQVEARQGYWQYGLILMLVALVGESLVGRV